MDLDAVASLARDLMDQHGLDNVPLAFDRSKTVIGWCHHRAMGDYSWVEKIVLSKEFMKILPEDEIRDVILHEIAHALAPFNAYHDIRWQVIAKRIGAEPVACKATSISPPGAYKAICPNGHESEQYRLPRKRVYTCGRCSPRVFNPRVVLSYYRNGVKIPLEDMNPAYQEAFKKHVGALV
jgi:predicted SprT family Zn-dependent metalloprotease